MAIEHKSVEASPAPPIQQYPIIQLVPGDQGILIVVQDNPLHTESFTIPSLQADAISSAYLALRPKAVWAEALRLRRQRETERETVASVMRNRPPKLVQK